MLYEKYRPKNFSDFIGQGQIIARIKKIMSRREWDRDVIWLQGPSGTGKTTLAWIICREYCIDCMIDELDGNKCTQEQVRKVEHDFQFAGWGGGFRAVIVNEAHAMTKQAVQAWLTLLENLPAKRLVIFTTTEIIKKDLFGNFSSPFESRCKVFTFKSEGLSHEFGKRCRQIARKEKLGLAPLKKFEYLVMTCKNNMRLALQRIEACEFV